MSGHNKWSKVKHKKAATDAKKSKLFSKHSRLITLESKKAKGDTSASGLRAAIERAKRDLMPGDNIERAIEKGAGGESDALEEMVYEAYGPGGTACVIVALTDNRNRTGQEVKSTLAKLGYQLGSPGSALWAFDKHDGAYVPKMLAQISDQEGEQLGELVEALEEIDDVQDVYTAADDAPGANI